MRMQVSAKQICLICFAFFLRRFVPFVLVAALVGTSFIQAEINPAVALILEECGKKTAPSGSYVFRVNCETKAQQVEAEIWVEPGRVSVSGAAQYKSGFELADIRREPLVGRFRAELSKRRQILYREDESLMIISENKFLPTEICCHPACWLWDPSLGGILEFSKSVLNSENYEVDISSESSGQVVVTSRYKKRSFPDSKTEFIFDGSNRMISYACMPLGRVNGVARPWYGAEFEWETLEDADVDWVRSINQWQASEESSKELVRKVQLKDFRELSGKRMERITTDTTKLPLGVKVLNTTGGASSTRYSRGVGSEFEYALKSRAFEMRKALGLFGGDTQ